MVVVWLGGTFVSTLLFPSFSWTADTLAAAGRAGRPSALLFDASIVLGALLGIVFLGRLWPETTHPHQRAGIGLIAALVALTGGAQLGLRNPWFELIALAFVLLLLPALAIFGSGDVLAGRPRRGLLAVWLGVTHLLAWQVLTIIMGLSAAVPTLLSLALLSTWVLSLYVTTCGERGVGASPPGAATDATRD